MPVDISENRVIFRVTKDAGIRPVARPRLGRTAMIKLAPAIIDARAWMLAEIRASTDLELLCEHDILSDMANGATKMEYLEELAYLEQELRDRGVPVPTD